MKIYSSLPPNLSFKNSHILKKEENFKSFLFNQLKKIDQSQKKASQALEALAKGEEIDLSEVILAIYKAEIDFKFLLKIRNKIIEAYQEIMRMQI